MMIFLILSVVLVAFTVIYLNKKKTPFNKSIKEDSQNNKKIRKIRKRNLQDILNIEIKDSIIHYGTRCSSIIKLGNIDYNMLSESEQEGVENVLIQTALSIDYPVQFFSTTEYIDTTKVTQNIRQNSSNNEKIQKYQESFIHYLENLMENKNISVVKNYVVISYDGYLEDCEDELNRRLFSFKNSLIRAKIQCEVLNENELYNLIYRELNKNSNSRIDFLKKGSEHLYVGKKQEKGKKED